MPFVLGNALLGSIGVFVHEAQAAPSTVTWFRCAFGLLGLTLWMAWRRPSRGRWRGWWRGLWVGWIALPWVLLLSGLMLTGWWLFFTAIAQVPTGVAVVLFHVQPLWVLVLGAWWLKESMPRQRVLSVLGAMVGLVLATGVAEGLAAPGGGQVPGYWRGVALCLVGALCTAVVTVVAKRLQALPVGTLAWWQCALGSVVLWVAPAEQGWPAWGASWAWLAGLGLIHTGLAYTLMYAGMARMSTTRVAVLQFAYPVVAIVVDWAYFQQSLGALQLVGVLLMLGSIGVGERMARSWR
ncbi:DMT family transporter [Acidovorax sp. JHL-9]|uniref:DMT family transporter n=1 Tax=Acidovorax sp. JHL-9 TaxID=1276756 RepID=UPI000686A3F7|nr:DMT family transporter [Acidovorax sp. JHL-9]